MVWKECPTLKQASPRAWLRDETGTDQKVRSGEASVHSLWQEDHIGATKMASMAVEMESGG